MKNSRILRKAALGPAPNVGAEYALMWVEPGSALVSVYELFPVGCSVGHQSFGGLTESEARLALLFVAASEEWDGR